MECGRHPVCATDPLKRVSIRLNHCLVASCAGRSASKTRVNALITRASIYFAKSLLKLDGLPGQAHDCPARFVLDGVHDVDSTRFQEFANQLDTRKEQRRAAPEYRFSWAAETHSVDGSRSACGRAPCRSRSAGPQDQSPSDRDVVWAAVQCARPARDRNEPAKPREQALSSRRLHRFEVGALDG